MSEKEKKMTIFRDMKEVMNIAYISLLRRENLDSHLLIICLLLAEKILA